MINVVGLGYIGLPTALMLADSGLEVVGTDISKEVINTLQAKKVTFEEPGLNTIFESALEKGIKFELEYIESDFYIITVPTPYDKKSKKIDPCYVIEAVKQVLTVCRSGAIIVIESTVSPGTIDKYIRPILEDYGYDIGKDIHLAHAPERILPGQMIRELKSNSRTIGADDLKIAKKVKEIYSRFCQGEIATTSIRTAEMTKVVENTFRAINIAFANELTKLARQEAMDVYEIVKIANMHPRVNILNPGPGVGGHCIPVDPWFLVGDYPRLTNLISTALEINESMPDHVLNRINEVMIENGIKDKNKVGIYGLTYKPDVEDIRESPTLQMFEKMSDKFSDPFRVYDPLLNKKILESQTLDFERFVEESEIIVIMQSHSHIKENIKLLRNKIILDTQNFIEDAYKL
ncbi:nucleotide sugar dehydrogenase [Lactococcus lactis]|uniref:nucleotide sugar dehydrogenase n=1 Tax=Lactococcus lactis TaxID=1358 RepID=UPI0016520991|nr:nucleotide sugar dehydrogenase [Lactococcus lactis]QNL92849.1 nucleotide sugar dehydrogenase [Lactococcus lactis]